jgi:HSP20 family protein
MVMRFDPFREMDHVAQLVNEQVGTARSTTMPMDAYERKDQFVVRLDLPGVDPASIDLTVEKNVLPVRAERSWQPDEDQEVIVQERPQGVCTRQLFLSEALDAEHVEASYSVGVLTLTIPVAVQAKPRKVSVIAGQRERSVIEPKLPQAVGA